MKMFFLISILFLLFSSVLVSSAPVKIFLDSDLSSDNLVSVSFKNEDSVKLKNTKVVVSVVDSSVRVSSLRSDVAGRDSKFVTLFLDESIPNVDYVRVVVSNDDFRRVRHRQIIS